MIHKILVSQIRSTKSSCTKINKLISISITFPFCTIGYGSYHGTDSIRNMQLPLSCTSHCTMVMQFRVKWLCVIDALLTSSVQNVSLIGRCHQANSIWYYDIIMKWWYSLNQKLFCTRSVLMCKNKRCHISIQLSIHMTIRMQNRNKLDGRDRWNENWQFMMHLHLH